MDEQAIEGARSLATAALWPGLAALAILLGLRFAVNPRRELPWAYPIAFAAAYSLGHALSAGADFSLIPERTFHWLFYLVPAASVASIISTRWRAASRAELILFVAFLSAGLLTARPSLWSQPAVFAGIVANVVYLGAGWTLLQSLSRRIAPLPFSAACWLSAAALAATIAEQASLSEGRIVAGAAGALVGITLFALVTKSLEPPTMLAPAVAIALYGWAWRELLLESRFWPLLILPLAPAALWLTQVGPESRPRRAFLQVASFAIEIGVIATVVYFVRATGGEW